ncbi:hypothetical protein RRG08_027650 [Elysia crispata]|uniref:Uncharacterized protein n=1 Tax=Elysia crispata TaxID=231223 RepID=A0AAE1CIW3_9GAST|nr:hypothetical protein RRG08_027650 [Elysia crispata]
MGVELKISVKPGSVGIDERRTRNSSSTALSLSLFLVFTAVRFEKLTSHRYVVENGNNVNIALLASMGNFLAAAKQKLSKGRSAELVSVQLVLPDSLKLCPFQQLMLN